MMRCSLLFAIALHSLFPSFAIAQPVNWANSFLLQSSGGFENPLIRLAFNPQPEPPIDLLGQLDLSEPTMPTIVIPDIAVNGGAAQILFAIQEGFSLDDGGMPDGDTFSFQAVGPSPVNVVFTMTTGSGGVPDQGSWVGFNPQPEPPAGFEGIGYEFEFTSNSPATLALQMFDDGVEPLSFELVAPADFNQSGGVDDIDLEIWFENYSAGSGADANLNGTTEGDDYLRWQQQYTGPPGLGAVPEPSGVILFLLAVAPICLRHT